MCVTYFFSMNCITYTPRLGNDVLYLSEWMHSKRSMMDVPWHLKRSITKKNEHVVHAETCGRHVASLVMALWHYQKIGEPVYGFFSQFFLLLYYSWSEVLCSLKGLALDLVYRLCNKHWDFRYILLGAYSNYRSLAADYGQRLQDSEFHTKAGIRTAWLIVSMRIFFFFFCFLMDFFLKQ